LAYREEPNPVHVATPLGPVIVAMLESADERHCGIPGGNVLEHCVPLNRWGWHKLQTRLNERNKERSYFEKEKSLHRQMIAAQHIGIRFVGQWSDVLAFVQNSIAPRGRPLQIVVR